MSRLLEAALDLERRLECARNDAALVAAMYPMGKAMRLDRRAAVPAAGDAMDVAMAGIEAGAQRVEVLPPVADVEAMRKDGAL